MKKKPSFYSTANQVSNIAMWFLLVCAAATFLVGEWWLAGAETVLFAVLLFLNLSIKKHREIDLADYVQRLNDHLDTATKDTLVNFPFPMVVTHLDGKVSWYNRSFANIIGRESLFERFLTDVFEDLDWSEVLRMQEGISLSVAYGDRRFQVSGSIIKPDARRENEYLVLLYWLDVTEQLALKQKYVNEKPDLCIIMIDNYDDVMNATADNMRPQLTSEIDKRINEWTRGASGVLKKTERDRYIFLFEHRYLDALITRKFELLDWVREINVGNKTPATISIGIGTGGTLKENDAYSRMALDMALGRGGDQAVIKDDSQFAFYGGKTKEHEKSTRVKSRVVAYALRQLVSAKQRTVIMGHHNPDIDAIGAAIGLARGIRNLGVGECYIVCGEHNQTVENLLLEFRDDADYEGVFVSPAQAEELVDQDTVLIVVDTHRPTLTENPKLLSQAGEIVVIDHHRRATEFIENCSLVYHEPYASSTCEMVAELLQYMDSKVSLSKKEAEAMYAGICMDTKNFIFKTGVRTFDAASFLRKHGVDTVAVKQMFQYDLEHYTSRAAIVGSAEFVHETVAIATCDQAISDVEVVAAQAADELLNIAGINASFVLAKDEDLVLISGRSLGDINVQVILEKLGGGGHMTVAGAQLSGTDVPHAKERLVAAIDEYFEESKKI